MVLLLLLVGVVEVILQDLDYREVLEVAEENLELVELEIFHQHHHHKETTEEMVLVLDFLLEVAVEQHLEQLEEMVLEPLVVLEVAVLKF